MSSNAIVNYTKEFAMSFISATFVVLIPISLLIGIVGVITTAIYHSMVPRPGRSLYLILTEASSSITIVINALLLSIVLLQLQNRPVSYLISYSYLIIYSVLGIISCALGITALSIRPSEEEDTRLSDAVHGLLWTTVVLQATCVLGIILFILYLLDLE